MIGVVSLELTGVQIKTVTLKKLETIPEFKDLSPTTLERLAEIAEFSILDSDAIIYPQNADIGGFFALLSGRVKLYRTEGEREQILSIVTPGECFGAGALIEGNLSPCAAQTMELAEIVVFPSEKLQSLFKDCPDLRVVMLRLVSSRLQQFVTLVHNFAFHNVASRLATVLLTRLDDEAIVTEEGIRFRRKLSQRELASIVGTAREVIYRTFKQFERDELLIVTRTHITILDRARLETLAQQESR